jgi:hypothetical protein
MKLVGPGDPRMLIDYGQKSPHTSVQSAIKKKLDPTCNTNPKKNCIQ